METRCKKCDSPVGAEQAFCPKCGAVIGMSAAAPQGSGGWDMASTVVGQNRPTTPPRSTGERRGKAAGANAAPAPPAPRGSNKVLLAIIGFVAVLLVGGLLILLFYLKS